MTTGSRPDAVARRIAGVVAGVGLAVLAGTGIWLFFFYQPAVAAAWTDIGSIGDGRGASFWVRFVHRLATPLTLLAVLSWVALNFLARLRDRGTVGAIVALGAVVAAVTGLWLPWDQLALGSVTVGTDIAGYERILQADDVRFVLIDGQRISLSTMQRLLVLHLVAGTAGAVLMAAALLRRRKAVDDRPGTSDQLTEPRPTG